MLKVDIIISKRKVYINNLAHYYENSNILRLVFKSEEEYLSYMQSLTLTNFASLESVVSEKINKVFTPSEIKKAILEAPPHFELKTIDDLPTTTIKNRRKIYLNLTKLSFKETFAILKNSLIHENVIFFDKYNEGKEMSLKNLLTMYEQLLTCIKKAKEKEYSPVESLYFAYNIVKSRVFKDEDKNEDKCKSRSLSEVLKSDKIVCAGFANYLLCLCDLLEIPAEKIVWVPKQKGKVGHETIAVYLNDPKYNILGIFAIDPTWDCKENQRDKKYKNDITHFLVPMNMEKEEKEQEELNTNLNCSYYAFLKIFEGPTNKLIIDNETELAFKVADRIFSYLGLPRTDQNLHELYETIKELGKRNISTETLRQIITAVEPKSNVDMKKTLKTSPYEFAEKQKRKLTRKRYFFNY